MAFKIERLSAQEALGIGSDDRKAFYDRTRRGSDLSPKGDGRPRMVICIDGEGKNLKGTEVIKRRKHSNWSFSREQIYSYLAASNSSGTFVQEISSFQAGLTTEECFKFLLKLPENALKVGFAFNYDVNMMLGTLREPRYRRYLEMLQKKQSVRWKGYTITLIPHKSFSISYTDADGTKRTCVVWDSFSYFQGAFVKALRDWHIGSNEEVDLITQMKDKRSDFDVETDEDVSRYCKLECRLGAEMFERVLEMTNKAGLKLMRYDGAGSVAHAMIRKHNITQYMHQTTNRLPDEVILSGYQGGRFDLSSFGHVGNAVEWDINSAYPYQALHLPCLSHGAWKHTTNYDGRAPWAIWFVSWNLDKYSLWSPFPYRTSGHGEGYLRNGSGWYWANEVQEAIKLYPSSIQVHEGFIFDRACSHEPFAFINEYYDLRTAFKEAGDLAELIIKLGLNSLYGKLAQNVGRFGSIPKSQCYTWAGIITSNTRAMLLASIRENPDDALLVATDAVFKRTNQDTFATPSGLGEWKGSFMPFLFIASNGFYQSIYQRQDGSWGVKKNKTRGFPEKYMYAPDEGVTADLMEQLQAGNAPLKGLHKPHTNHWKVIRDQAKKSDRFDYTILRQDYITLGAAVKDNGAHFDDWRRWLWRPHTLRYGEFPNKELRDGRVFPGENKTPDVPSAPYEPEAYRYDEDVPVVTKNDLSQRALAILIEDECDADD